MSGTRRRRRTPAFDPSAGLIALLALLLAACNGNEPTDVDPGACGWTGVGASNYALVNPGPPPFVLDGTQTRWDPNLRLISLGPEEVGDGEPDVALTMVIAEPVSTVTGCEALVTWANLVAHDVQVGTGDEIGAQYFELIDGSCGEGSPSQVRIQSIGRFAIVVSAYCLTLQRIIIHPNGATERGQIVRVTGEFTAVAP